MSGSAYEREVEQSVFPVEKHENCFFPTAFVFLLASVYALLSVPPFYCQHTKPRL